MRYKLFVLVDASGNRNAFFSMKQETSLAPIDTVMNRVRNGQMGKGYQKPYPASCWDLLVTSHLQKGFQDVTDLYREKAVEEGLAPLEDKEINRLFDQLVEAQESAIKKLYTVSFNVVTQAMVDEGQSLIHQIAETADRDEVNDLLIRLFETIPREMADVDAMLLHSDAAQAKQDILMREQEVLDLMASRVARSGKAGQTRHTILDEIGLSVRHPDEREQAQIEEMLSRESRGLLKQAVMVENALASARLTAWEQAHGASRKDEHFLFHGTRSRNVLGILHRGLQINPDAPRNGSMFGHGSYFAARAKKSLGYTDLKGYGHWVGGQEGTGYLLVFRVAYRHQKDVHLWTPACSDYSGKRIRPYDAVFAHKGRDLVNDEIIVYDEAQSAPWALLEMAPA